MSQMPKPGPDPEVSDDEIIQVIRSVPFPFAKTADISEETGMTQTWARERLNRLAEAGHIRRRKISKGGIIWWLED